MNIGLSLLFYSKTSKKIMGILKSYVLNIKKLDVNEITAKASDKADQQLKELPSNTRYLGVEDIYLVVGSCKEGSLLGRVTYYEYNSKVLAKSLVKKKSEYSFYGEELNSSIKYFNVRAVYFYRDTELKDDSFAFIATTIVKASTYSKALTAGSDLVKSKSFKKKILRGSIERLQEANIEFLGFNDVCPVFDRVDKGGAYETFYNGNVSSIKELSRQLIQKSDIKKKLKSLEGIYISILE